MAPVASVFTNPSIPLFVSPGTRFDAAEVKPISVPSGDHTGTSESSLAWVPVASTEIRWIAPEASVFTNRSR